MRVVIEIETPALYCHVVGTQVTPALAQVPGARQVPMDCSGACHCGARVTEQGLDHNALELLDCPALREARRGNGLR